MRCRPSAVHVAEPDSYRCVVRCGAGGDPGAQQLVERPRLEADPGLGGRGWWGTRSEAPVSPGFTGGDTWATVRSA
eukprot:10398054-Alexandrium_andersonii.AAC.1